jgi:hypothetical protein
MGQLFQQTLRLTKDRQPLLESQRAWLAQRDGSCGALADASMRSCVLEMTKSRATSLTKIAASATYAAQTSQSSPSPVLPTTPERRTELPAEARSKNGSPTNTPVPDSSPGSTIPLVIPVCSAAIALRFFRAFRRKQRLAAKYGEEIAILIIAGKVCLGKPADVGREIIKSKTKETWKYGQTGRNRFSNRVYLENGIVIGWKI